MSLQLVWLVRELVKSGMMGADGVVMTLLKQIAGQTHTHTHTHTHTYVALSVSGVFMCVLLQVETFPLRTFGWPRASSTSSWTRSTSVTHT